MRQRTCTGCLQKHCLQLLKLGTSHMTITIGMLIKIVVDACKGVLYSNHAHATSNVCKTHDLMLLVLNRTLFWEQEGS